jgi:hypothetical protein
MPLSIAEYETMQADFLDFGKSETKRIAYAASFGTRKLTPTDIKLMTPLLNRFSYISVREEASGRQPPFIYDEDFSILDSEYANNDVSLRIEKIHKTYNAAWIQEILSKPVSSSENPAH